MPRPAQLELARGEFALRDAHALQAPRGDAVARDVAQLLAERVARSCGRTLLLDPPRRPRGAPIRIERIARGAAVSPEAYRLEVRRRAITLAARDDAGLRQGASTLLQLLCAVEADAVPALRIDDAPRFAWRGLMLDSARHYQSPEFIRRFLDAMALHKLSVLHWHLTDDQAWRLQIRKYPRLTEVGAWRVPAGAAPRADIDPATGAPRRYGGWYDQDTVRGIVAYAARLGIMVVPEIEMPGHASAAIAAYPELGAVPGAVRDVPADWGVYANAFALDDATFAFLEDVLTEVMELFPSPYLHVGGDEVERGQWLESESGQARLRGLGGDPARLQPYFTQRMARFLESRGRRLVGWDEILTPGLAGNAVVMSWRGVDGAIQAARQGHDAVLSPWPALYFDNRQSDAPEGPPGRLKVISLESVYHFEPMPAALDAAQQRHVLGLQAAVWTEHIRTEQRVGYMTFPRAAAVAELGWTVPERRDWTDFRRRLVGAYPHYTALGLAYAPAEVERAAAAAASGGAQRRGSRELALCTEQIALGLEDDAPLLGERAVFAVDIQNPCWLFRGADLSRAGAVIARVGQVPFNFQIGAAAQAIRFATPTTPDGELEVRLDRCDGELLARLPLAPARAEQAVTTLPRAALAPRAGRHDLCLRFAQHGLDPLWVLDAIELVPP